MALDVVTIKPRTHAWPGVTKSLIRVTFDSSLAAGGEDLDLSAYAQTAVYMVSVLGSDGACPYSIVPILGTYSSSLKGFPPADVKLTAYEGEYTAVADGPLVEAATKDLSGITITLEITAN
jgi:hypothetical protein